MSTTILYEDRSFQTPAATVDDAGLWLPLDVFTEATGWQQKPEGICREDICIPVPPNSEAVLLGERTGEGTTDFNVTEFARLIEQPFAHDDVNDAWYFGPPAWEWKDRLRGGIAPDFELPDFEGRLHRLSEHRGSKVLLALWASWCGCRFDLPVWNNLR